MAIILLIYYLLEGADDPIPYWMGIGGVLALVIWNFITRDEF